MYLQVVACQVKHPIEHYKVVERIECRHLECWTSKDSFPTGKTGSDIVPDFFGCLVDKRELLECDIGLLRSGDLSALCLIHKRSFHLNILPFNRKVQRFAVQFYGDIGIHSNSLPVLWWLRTVLPRLRMVWIMARSNSLYLYPSCGISICPGRFARRWSMDFSSESALSNR